MLYELALIWGSVLLLWCAVRKIFVGPSYPPIPGPPGLPLIGNTLMFWGKPEFVFQQLRQLTHTYTRLMGIWIGPKLHVALFDARDAEVLLRASSKYVEKAEEYRFMKPWLGESILISTGAKFKKNKKLIMPAFHMNVLKSFLDTFNTHSRRLVDSLGRELGASEFDIHDYLSTEAMNVLLETAMGVSKETLGSSATDYAHAIEKVCKIVHIRAYTLWLRPDWLFHFSALKRKQDECLRIVHSLTEQVIRCRREELTKMPRRNSDEEIEEDAKKRNAVLDMLLEASLDGQDLTDQEIMDEVLTMMFAGQDTTAGTTGFALSLLGLYHDIQDKVVAELDDIFGETDRPVTYEDIVRMEYLERVIYETLRLYPAIPMIARKPVQDLKLDGYVLPKSSTVAVIIMQLHRNPRHFDRPHEFNPDNFLPERVKERHPYSFIPFSAGFRTCIGPKYSMMKIKVLLAHILRSYRVYSTREEREFVLSAQTTLKRREGFLLRIERRDPNRNTTTTASTCDENDIDVHGAKSAIVDKTPPKSQQRER